MRNVEQREKDRPHLLAARSEAYGSNVSFVYAKTAFLFNTIRIPTHGHRVNCNFASSCGSNLTARPPFSAIVPNRLRRSRVDRAKRSSRVTTRRPPSLGPQSAEPAGKPI